MSNNENELARKAKLDRLVVRRDAEAAKASLQRVADTVERASTMGDLAGEVVESTMMLCLDLMQSLEPISDNKLPTRETRSVDRDPYDSSSRFSGRPQRDSHLKINSPEVAQVLNQYDQLGFQRMRCYVRTGRASLTVATYDLMVPTWNGAMLYDPADSWGGSDKQWLGFRPATGPTDVTVLSASNLPVTSTDERFIPDRANYKAIRADGFHWAKVDPEWQVSYTPDLAICKLFIQQTKTLLNEVGDALDVAINGLRDVLKTAAGEHLLALEDDGAETEVTGTAAAPQDRPAAPGKPVSTNKPAAGRGPTPPPDVEIG